MIGIHEMVANALIFPEESERKTDLRLRPLNGFESEETDED